MKSLCLPLAAFLALALLPLSCRSEQVSRETPLPSEVPVPARNPQPSSNSGGLVDEIRSLTEKGYPSALLDALEIIRSRDLSSTEFGRMMITVNVTLLKTIYPSFQAELPNPDPPLTHVYARILREAERGVYVPPQPNSYDYLEYVLPFLAYYPDESADPNAPRRGSSGPRVVQPERFLSALPDLEKAAEINPDSVLADLFAGIAYEYSGRLDYAFSYYARAWEQFPECFPAALKLARVMEAQGRKQEATRFLQDLVVYFPDNLQVKRELALAYYRGGDWSRAETAVAEILQRNSRDGEFVLMRAHILVEQGQMLQAQAPLDIYATINPNNRLYLFLRARVQAEAYHNRDAALNYMRSIIRSSQAGSPAAENAEQNQDELLSAASIYAARLMMESPRSEDQEEGRNLLAKLLAVSPPALDVVSLALEDAVRREEWPEARAFLARLLEERRSAQDLLAACMVERGQGNNAAALSYARELYERDRSNDEGIINYVSALIETGRAEEASRMIDSRINAVPGGVLKSRYFYLRSRVRNNEELVMNDLRSSLFEDPRNLDALVAMFEIYHRRRDERRAVYYLKQALALAPENLRLKRYEQEYGTALGSAF